MRHYLEGTDPPGVVSTNQDRIMHIIMFQYHRETSAIIQENSMGRENGKYRLMGNSILANGYTDRFLWEEAASLKPKKNSEYHIPGVWQ